MIRATNAALIALLLSAGSLLARAQDEPDEAPKLNDLASVDELKTEFNAGKGKIRLLLLLSPT